MEKTEGFDLFVHACARPGSRTMALAEKILERWDGSLETLDLYREKVTPLDYSGLVKREACIERGDYSDDMFRFAGQFARAKRILIAAPYWDLSFPSVLKCYLEAVCVRGLTFSYTDDGRPEGLCRTERLVYVTTAGGPLPKDHAGYAYVRDLCTGLFGIRHVECLCAEGLDVYGADVENILQAAVSELALHPERYL